MGLQKYSTCQIAKNISEQVHRYSTSVAFKAAIVKEIGKPLEVEQVKSDIGLAANEIRLRVQYCSVNYLDCLIFRTKTRTPYIPGYELAGEVLEVGSGVSAKIAIVGERVVALSLEKFSGFAQQCVLNALDVFRLPTHVDPRNAAVLVCNYSAAVFGFSRICRHAPTESSIILISCGPGGMGMAAVDVASSIYLSKVIGVCDTEKRAALIRDKGAFAAFKFDKNTLRDQVLAQTDNRGVEFIYDSVGETTLDTMSSCIAARGIIMSTGYLEKNYRIEVPPPNSSFCSVNLHALRIQDFTLYRQVIEDTMLLADQDLLNPYISATYTLDQINDAIKYLEETNSTGKVLIEIAHE